ncbi:PepSY domain-containing protein [Virgibacillus halodenitrificans]|jgi:predicted small secreted protein|uniref:PepSY domain-containing protein n=1 Tax=Virgibacillus halodenitrificans TaxID=1482 RepID=A0AAC9NKV4_VIRHA|nr:PepSY domain-containing protein [Virgibacillus halodenitrificans]APC47981.1 peptidase M4 [Virgibacillus halodenitrificans]MBD1223879.1 PepSY domain-containing protein [Virgibacillus halodenitrificans]MCG1027748.1 PepSY domain-containing protein [Virgibacillus halodenitrificans]MCJ0931798.1 PepSY domain-containing protein [Virgibacillus halodenitrificans]MEC2159803.1 PepSY domain-containing protein [Virgibacillus halodenitrificans]
MNVKKAVLAAGVGVAVGYVAKQQLDNYQKITPEKALKKAKETFKKNGPISGSWIYMKPEEVERNGLMYNAYRGGVTRNKDGENMQYEFYVDVETGAVIDTIQTA